MSIKPRDISNQKFGALTTVSYIDKGKWNCICDCGNSTIVNSTQLIYNKTKSCGCKKMDVHTKHKKRKTRQYTIWSNMKQRCLNSSAPAYQDYGGRGITICPAWVDDFQTFYNWAMSNGYDDALTIDRINNNSGYSPDNCRWVTRLEQSHNTRKPKSNTSTVRGVNFHIPSQKYRASIRVNGKQIHLGMFTDLQQAEQARLEAESKYW